MKEQGKLFAARRPTRSTTRRARRWRRSSTKRSPANCRRTRRSTRRPRAVDAELKTLGTRSEPSLRSGAAASPAAASPGRDCAADPRDRCAPARPVVARNAHRLGSTTPFLGSEHHALIFGRLVVPHPTFFVLFVFGVVPFLYVLVIGFTQWYSFAADPSMHFVWAENFRRLVFDEQFLRALWLTLMFALFAVAGEVVLGSSSPVLHAGISGQGLLPHHPYLPLVVARSRSARRGGSSRCRASALALLFRPLVRLRVQHQAAIRARAFTATVVMDIWHWTPLVTLTLLAPSPPCRRSRSSRRRSTAPTDSRSSGTSRCRC